MILLFLPFVICRFYLFEIELCVRAIAGHVMKCNRAASSEDAEFKERSVDDLKSQW